MLRHQMATPLVMPGPLLLSALGAAFCVWSASGNALNLCVTTGCSLFQDFTIGGISMWWFGAVGFALLVLLSLSGRPMLGVAGAGLCVVLDVLLLALMLATAPCVGCLFAALLFALVYLAFRHSNNKRDQHLRRSWLLLLWAALFVANVGAVVKAEADTWPMHGPNDPAVRLFFSPSCSSCREAVNALSGRVNVAFYPLVENDQDLPAIAVMIAAVDKGDSMAEALAATKNLPAVSTLGLYAPEYWLLRFRLLCNKAHVLASGSESIPYMEFHGLPNFLSPSRSAAPSRPETPMGTTVEIGPGGNSQDDTLPIDTGVAGSCGGVDTPPCP